MPDPAPAGKLYALTIGLASEGDKNTLEAMAVGLSLPVTVEEV